MGEEQVLAVGEDAVAVADVGVEVWMRAEVKAEAGLGGDERAERAVLFSARVGPREAGVSGDEAAVCAEVRQQPQPGEEARRRR